MGEKTDSEKRDSKLLDLDADSNLVQSYKYEDDIRLPYPRLWVTFSVETAYKFDAKEAEKGTSACIRFGGYDWFPMSYRQVLPQSLNDPSTKDLEDKNSLYIYSAFCAPASVFRVVIENVASSKELAEKCDIIAMGESISLQETISIRNQPLGVILAQYNAAMIKQYSAEPKQVNYLRVSGKALVSFSLKSWDKEVKKFSYTLNAIQVSMIYDSLFSRWRSPQPPLSSSSLSFWSRLLGDKLEMNLGFAIPASSKNYDYNALYEDPKKAKEETTNIPKAVAGFCYNIEGQFVDKGSKKFLLARVVEDSQIPNYPTKYTFTEPDFTCISYTEGTPSAEF